MPLVWDHTEFRVAVSAVVLLSLTCTILTFLLRMEKSRASAARQQFEVERASLIKHFDHLTREASDAILLFDANLGVIDANDRALHLYGYAMEQIRKLKMSDLRSRSEQQNIQSTIQWVNEVGSSRYETVHVDAKGHQFPVEATLRAIDLDEGRAYQNIVRDITARKSHEATMRRLNIVNQFLSRVNQALFQSSQEEQALQRVCQQAVKVGEYSAAAVFLCDANGVARVVAQEGLSADGIANLTMDPDSPGAQNTLTARAIREKRLQVTNNYMPDPARVLRNNSSKTITAGSLAACPLKRAGEVVGAITLGASRTNFFVNDETALLEVLSSDISNALDLFAAKQNLMAAQDRMRQQFTAIEQSPVSVVITDTKGTIEYVNPKFCEISGYSLEETIGQNPRILKSGETSSEVYRQLWQTILSGRIWRGDLHNRRKDGSLYWESTTIAPVQDEQGRIVRFVGIKEDITELKIQRQLTEQALHRLETAEEQFRSLFEDAPVAYHEIDAEGIVVRANRAECELLGVGLADLVGRPIWNLIAPEQQAVSREAIRSKISGASPLTVFTRTFRRGDGSDVIFEIHERLVYAADGKAIGIRSALLDVTARQKAEAQLSLAVQQLDQSNNAKNRFLAMMSHELRTPIVGILGLAEILLSNASAEQLEDLQEVRACATRLLKLIQEILDFTDSAVNPIRPSEFRVDALVTEVWQSMAAQLETKDLQLVTHVAQGVPEEILADREKLLAILRALVDNAVKFTSRGEVGVSVRLDKDGGDEWLRFVVSDTGIGIPEQVRKQVFEPFVQADMTHARKVGGVGLGLSVAVKTAVMLGGRIWMDEHGASSGTVMNFRLPLQLPVPVAILKRTQSAQ